MFRLCCCLYVRQWLARLLMIAGSFHLAGMCSSVGSCMSFVINGSGGGGGGGVINLYRCG